MSEKYLPLVVVIFSIFVSSTALCQQASVQTYQSTWTSTTFDTAWDTAEEIYDLVANDVYFYFSNIDVSFLDGDSVTHENGNITVSISFAIKNPRPCYQSLRQEDDDSSVGADDPIWQAYLKLKEKVFKDIGAGCHDPNIIQLAVVQ